MAWADRVRTTRLNSFITKVTFWIGKMRFLGSLVTTVKTRWRESVMWLILVCYLGALWLLANSYWHVIHFFAFMGIFLTLTLLVIIAFKVLKGIQ